MYLGYRPVNSTVVVDFNSFAAAGGSVTITGLAVTDIEIYKDSSMTQRASDNGYALLDTDGIDIDTITGIQGFTIDLSDNSDAGFYAAGSYYRVVVSAVTIDGQTVNFTAARFDIGVQPANVTQWLGTAPATPTVAGVPEVDLTHVAGSTTDVSTIPASVAAILVDTGTTLDGRIPAALGANGNMKADLRDSVGVAVTSTGGIPDVRLGSGITHGNTSTTIALGTLSAVTSITAGAMTISGAVTMTNASNDIRGIGSFTTAAKAELQTEAQDAITASSLPTAAQVRAEMDSNSTQFAAIVADTNELQTDWANGGRLDLILDAILDDTGTSGVVVAAGSKTGYALTSGERDSIATAAFDLAAGVETGLTLRQAMRLIAAASAGKLSGAATTTIVIRNAVADSKDRITATVDADGNRSAITVDLT